QPGRIRLCIAQTREIAQHARFAQAERVGPAVEQSAQQGRTAMADVENEASWRGQRSAGQFLEVAQRQPESVRRAGRRALVEKRRGAQLRFTDAEKKRTTLRGVNRMKKQAGILENVRKRGRVHGDRFSRARQSR